MDNSQSLTQRHCVPCEGGTDPLSEQEEQKYLSAVPDWLLISEGIHRIERTFTFKNFSQALSFVQQLGAIAEEEGHHPDILLFDYKKVKVSLRTHAIKGLSENDFIMAAKIDERFSLPGAL